MKTATQYKSFTSKNAQSLKLNMLDYIFALISASLLEFKLLIIRTPIELSLLLDFLVYATFLRIQPVERSCAFLRLDLIEDFCSRSVDQLQLDVRMSWYGRTLNTRLSSRCIPIQCTCSVAWSNWFISVWPTKLTSIFTGTAKAIICRNSTKWHGLTTKKKRNLRNA